jgi:hypothetical protein
MALYLPMTTMNYAADDSDEELKFHSAKARDQQEFVHSLSDGSLVGQKLIEKYLPMTTMNLAADDSDEELKFHAAKAKDQQELVDSLSDGSLVGQKLVEKTMQYAELKQENDHLRYLLGEADRKHHLIDEERAATQEMMAELYDVVHSLQQNLDGGTMDEEHMLTINDGNIIIPRKARMKVKAIENERDEYKKRCDKFRREEDVLLQKGREREFRHNHSLKSMERTIQKVEKKNEGLTQKCDTFKQVVQELEREKALQKDKIEALEAQFQEFNTSRQGRSSSTRPYYEDTMKHAGVDYRFPGSTADVCLGPLRAKEEENQTSSPSISSSAHTTKSKHLNKHQQDEDDTTVANSSYTEEPSTSFDLHEVYLS